VTEVDAGRARSVAECILGASQCWPYLVQRLCQDFLTASTRDDGTFGPAMDWDAQRVLVRDPYAQRLLGGG
jgi:hypothetical protein